MFKLVKNVVKCVKVAVEYYGDIKNDDDNPIFKAEEIQPEGYIMRKGTGKLLTNGLAVAGVALVDFGTNVVPCIYVDKLYEKMTKNAQEFVIQHELGHFTHHREQLINGFERNDKMENEADEYAAQILGYDNVIEALKELKEMLLIGSMYCNKAGAKEIDRRIQYIENLK